MQNEIEPKNLEIEPKQNDVKSHHFGNGLELIEEVANEENKYEMPDFELVKNDIKFDIQAKLLKSIPSIGKFLSDNKEKTVKYISIPGHVVYHIRHYEIL